MNLSWNRIKVTKFVPKINYNFNYAITDLLSSSTNTFYTTLSLKNNFLNKGEYIKNTTDEVLSSI